MFRKQTLLALVLCTIMVMAAGCAGWGEDGPVDQDDQNSDDNSDLEDEHDSNESDSSSSDGNNDNSDSESTPSGSNSGGNGGEDTSSSSSESADSDSDSETSSDSSSSSVSSNSASDSDSTNDNSGTDDNASDPTSDGQSSDSDSDSSNSDSDSDSGSSDGDSNGDEEPVKEEPEEEPEEPEVERFTLTVAALYGDGDTAGDIDITVEHIESGESRTKDAETMGGTAEFEVIEGEYRVSAPVNADGSVTEKTVTVSEDTTVELQGDDGFADPSEIMIEEAVHIDSENGPENDEIHIRNTNEEKWMHTGGWTVYTDVTAERVPVELSEIGPGESTAISLDGRALLDGMNGGLIILYDGDGNQIAHYEYSEAEWASGNSANLSISVVDSEGEGVPGASVEATQGDAQMSEATDESGVATLTDLASGEWTVEVSADGYESSTQTVSLEDSEDRTLEVVLSESAPAMALSASATGVLA